MAEAEEHNKGYFMDIIEEEDGKAYAVFYNDKGEPVGKIHVKQTIQQWLEEHRNN